MPADATAGAPRPPADPARAERAARLAGCLERARAGEIGALEDVVRELNPLLWHVARAQGLDETQAADVVQTAWLELVRRLADIRSPQALSAWLVSTTKREAWQVRRRGRRTVQSDELAEVADDAPDLSERLVTDERDQVLWRHFQRLSQRCRELLRIVAMVERPDYTTVSEALGMPRGSIGPTRGRCLEKLRDLLRTDPQWSPR